MAEKLEGEEEDDDELQFDSLNFNALRALTLGNVPVPCPNVKPLDNIAQYVSLVSGKKKKKEEGETSKTVVPRGPVPAPRPKDAPPPPPPRVKVRSRHQRNFLLRMEEHDQSGPLSMLRRSVAEQLCVKVWTRSGAYIRGFCQGYIVAYDKHFNMAMIDVDETYRKPIFPKQNKKQIVMVPVIPSDSPPNTDEENSESESYTPMDLTEKDKSSWQVRLGKNIEVLKQDEEPQRFSKHCLSSVIEPCLVYNRLKTKVCYRHVNQLFIRGDNVVSISIVD